MCKPSGVERYAYGDLNKFVEIVCDKSVIHALKMALHRVFDHCFISGNDERCMVHEKKKTDCFKG